jgi:hypothetical protein
LAALLAFAYVAGPEIYRRATEPRPTTPSPAVGYIQKMGPLNTTNKTNALKTSQAGERIIQAQWWIVVTFPPENSEFARDFVNLLWPNLNLGRKSLPDYNIDLDAPHFPASEYSGIVLHGTNSLNDLIKQTFDQCFVIRLTAKPAEGLEDFYKTKNISWIEIGKGSPWRGSTACAE